jgi:hypothetical protein
MSSNGRRRKATAAQRAEVERLAAEGLSIRRIAAEVFGDARLRGRVERILGAPAASSATQAVPVTTNTALEGVDVSTMSTPALVRLLARRRLEELAASGETPSLTELRSLLDLERRYISFETLERADARMRAKRGSR